jgi:hypothetical protein
LKSSSTDLFAVYYRSTLLYERQRIAVPTKLNKSYIFFFRNRLREQVEDLEAVQGQLISRDIVETHENTIESLREELRNLEESHKQLMIRYGSLKLAVESSFQRYAIARRAEASADDPIAGPETVDGFTASNSSTLISSGKLEISNANSNRSSPQRGVQVQRIDSTPDDLIKMVRSFIRINVIERCLYTKDIRHTH